MWYTLLGPFFFFLVMGVPVAIAIGLASMLFLMITGMYTQLLTVQRIVLVVEAWPLIAIPLFILAGSLLATGKTGVKIIDFAYALVGHIWGGLAAATVVANMIMGGISGSAAADCSGIGSVVIPEMKRRGYPSYFVVALNACASPIGIIIPPSIPMIIFSWVSGASIARLFLGGVIPGILMGLFQIAAVYHLSAKYQWPRAAKREDLRTVLRLAAASWPALLAPILVIGGILSGIFTATEVAAMLFIYAVFIECILYKSFDLRTFLSICGTSARTVGIVMLVIATSNIFSHLLISLHVPQYMTESILSVTTNRFIILIWINIALLIVGCFMDLTPAILIFAPVVIPIGKALGMDIVHIGLMMVFNLAIGLFTPPVGTTLYISCSLGGVSMEEGSRGILPFFAATFIVLMLVTFIPGLSLWMATLVGSR